MLNEPAPFTPDAPATQPEGVIMDIREKGIEKTLGTNGDILYIGHRQIKAYTVEDWKVYIWSDSRGRENSIFISKEYVGGNHEVDWYRERKIIAKNIMKVGNQRDFIERCVLGEVTPESLAQ